MSKNWAACGTGVLWERSFAASRSAISVLYLHFEKKMRTNISIHLARLTYLRQR